MRLNMKINWRDNIIYYCNFFLIFAFIPIKIIDFLMSLEYIGTNNIVEANVLGNIFLENPILMSFVFIFFVFIFLIFNIYIHKSLEELIYLLAGVLFLMDLIGIYVLYNNFNILFKV